MEGLEQRISDLEKEVAELKRGLEARPEIDEIFVLNIIQKDVERRLDSIKIVTTGLTK